MFDCEWNMSLWDLQFTVVYFYLYFTQCLNFFRSGIIDGKQLWEGEENPEAGDNWGKIIHI